MYIILIFIKYIYTYYISLLNSSDKILVLFNITNISLPTPAIINIIGQHYFNNSCPIATMVTL